MLLQVLHRGRTRGPEARTPKAAQLLQRLRDKKMLYESPAGSNDDWYWIYAAARAGVPAAEVLQYAAKWLLAHVQSLLGIVSCTSPACNVCLQRCLSATESVAVPFSLAAKSKRRHVC